MSDRHRISGFVLGLLVGIVALHVAEAGARTIVLQSGTPPPTQVDSAVTYLVEPSGICGAGFAAAFGPADFAAADAGPFAVSVPNHPDWLPSLSCNSEAAAAHWMSIDSGRPPRSALYAVHFNVPDLNCIVFATMTFCWVADDALGDPGGPNPVGAYLNGTPLPEFSGGNSMTETSPGFVNIAGHIFSGPNTLYVYDRDLGCNVAGVMFSAVITIEECAVPVGSHSWGSLKTLYR